jgi:hypothetical protein
LSSGTSSVLLNGVPSKVFHCRRGLRQGDPLSPLLFVLVVDLLQTIINDAKANNLLTLPLPERAGTDFPIVQYADDTLLVMEACPRQLQNLKELLHIFSSYTRLKVNYNKSLMVPLNLEEGKLAELAQVFGCQTGALRFTYLGLPLGTTKPHIQDFMPLIQRVKGRLTCTSLMLSQGGKLEMVNTVFSSSAIFYTGTIKLHKGVVKQLDKYMKHCLWRGSDLNSKKTLQRCLANGLSAKKQGGLGVIDRSLHNDAMLLKFMHKFFNKEDIPWIQLIWENYYANGKLPSQNKRGSF